MFLVAFMWTKLYAAPTPGSLTVWLCYSLVLCKRQLPYCVDFYYLRRLELVKINSWQHGKLKLIDNLFRFSMRFARLFDWIISAINMQCSTAETPCKWMQNSQLLHLHISHNITAIGHLIRRAFSPYILEQLERIHDQANRNKLKLNPTMAL